MPNGSSVLTKISTSLSTVVKIVNSVSVQKTATPRERNASSELILQSDFNAPPCDHHHHFFCCISTCRQRGSDERGCHRSSECCITAIMAASITSLVIHTRGRRTKQNSQHARPACTSSFVPSQTHARVRITYKKRRAKRACTLN